MSSPSSVSTGYVAKTYNLIFSLATVIVMIGVLIKLIFSRNLPIHHHIGDPNSTFVTPTTFTSRMLAEHDASKRFLQEHRAKRLLLKQFEDDPSAFEAYFQSMFQGTWDDSSFLSSLPTSATCHPHNFSTTWNHTLFDSIPWEFLHTQKNIDTFKKHVPGSKLMAFRGVSLMENVHISHALGPFVNVSQSLDWVPVLKHIEALPLLYQTSPETTTIEQIKAESNVEYRWHQSDTIYQLLQLPWPITPRDLYLYRHFTFDAHRRQVTVHYHSLEETDVDRLQNWTRLHQNRVLRAVTPHTMWRFTVIPDDIAHRHPKTNTTTTEEEKWHHHHPETNGNDNEKKNKKLSKKFRKFNLVALWQKQIARFYRNVVVQTFQPLWRRLKRLVPMQLRPAPSLSRLSNIDKVKDDKVVVKEPRIAAVDETVATPTTTTTSTTPSSSCLPLPPHHQKHLLEKGGSAHVLVEVETVIDSRGTIPTWFVNFMQRQWPVTTLDTFRHLAMKGDITAHPVVDCW